MGGAADFAREWAQHLEQQMRAGNIPWGPPGGPAPGGNAWGDAGAWTGRHGRHGRPERGGPPPWVAGLLGLGLQETRGPKVRRGDVRAAILDVLRDEPSNGYQLIGQITERSGGAWKPSPGSVYPTLSQLEDEGLIASDESSGRRAFSLTDAGRAYVAANPEELSSVWEPFRPAEAPPGGDRGQGGGVRPEIGQVLNAVWQIVATGTDQQRKEAMAVLVETRRKLYGILAEGGAGDSRPADPENEEPQ